MFEAAPVSSLITTIPPNPMMESFSPVLPSVRRAIGFAGDAFSRLVEATAAAVMAAFLRNSRRFMIYLQGSEWDDRRSADILAQVLGKEQAAENSNFGSFVTGHD